MTNDDFYETLVQAREREKFLNKHYFFVCYRGLCFYPFTLENNYGEKQFTPEEWHLITNLYEFWVGMN